MNKNLLYDLYFYKALGYKFMDNFQNSSEQSGLNLNFNMLKKEVANCNLCELCKSRNRPVMSENLSGTIMLVQKSPNEQSDKSGDAKDGELFGILNDFGIASESLYLTYLLKCKTREIEKISWFEQCAAYLEREIEILNPRLIVLFGEELFFCLTKIQCAFNSVRGGIFEFKNHLIMPTYSLEWVKKNPSCAGEFCNDIEKIKGFK